MRQEASVNLVNFVHLKRNDQHLSFVYGQRCYLREWQLHLVGRRLILLRTAPDRGC